MAIEPVDSVVAREERFKCISCLYGYFVVTANSAGVISLMNLQGAIKMMNEGSTADQDTDGNSDVIEGVSGAEDTEDPMEFAVDIVNSVQLGTGARITCLAAWSTTKEVIVTENEGSDEETNMQEENRHESRVKRKNIGQSSPSTSTLDSAALEKARALVKDAKNLKEKKERKKRRKNRSE